MGKSFVSVCYKSQVITNSLNLINADIQYPPGRPGRSDWCGSSHIELHADILTGHTIQSDRTGLTGLNEAGNNIIFLPFFVSN